MVEWFLDKTLWSYRKVDKEVQKYFLLGVKKNQWLMVKVVGIFVGKHRVDQGGLGLNGVSHIYALKVERHSEVLFIRDNWWC